MQRIRVWQALCFETQRQPSFVFAGTARLRIQFAGSDISTARRTGRWRMLRILIADDHEVARQGIRALLEAHSGWEVCAEAKDGREAVELATNSKPDIVLLDIGMPNLNGLDAARQILAMSPTIRILILTMHDAEQVVR